MTYAIFTKPSASLPVELIDQVLSHLSPRHLINAALVCHSWARLARCQLYQDIYIHTNRQYTRWLETLEATCIEHRQLVRRIVIHPQVHLDLCDLPILRLCPWVESFDIGIKGTKSGYHRSSSRPHELNINDIIGRRHRCPQVLHRWRYLKRLHGYHSDPPTAWTCLSHSPLTSLVCSFDDICTLSAPLGNSTAPPYLSRSVLASYQPAYMLSDLVDLHLTFGCLDMPVATLEIIHTVCPALETLKLHVQSIHGTTTTSRMIGGSRTTATATATANTGEENGDDSPMDVSPVFRLKSLSLNDMVHFDPGCYSYLLHKYPRLATLHLGFAFDEFYASPLLDDRPTMGDDDSDGDVCAYLQKNRSDLFDLISGYRHLTRLEIHLQGANEYVTSLWPSEQMTKWMQQQQRGSSSGHRKAAATATKRTCGLQHLEMTYQRQSTEDSHDILGLDGIINSWVGQHQLQTLLLDVYNNSRNKNNNNDTADSSSIQIQQHNGQHSIQSTLDSFFYADDWFASGAPLLRNMTTLCIKCFPGFDVSLTCLLDGLPGLKILDLAFGNFISRKGSRSQSQAPCSSYGLRQLILGSSTITDTVHFMDLIQHHCQQLTTLCLENVVLDDGGYGGIGNTATAESKTHVWDLSNRGLKHAWIKYLSIGSKGANAAKGGMVNWLKVHESTANRSTWYHTSMAQGTHGSSKPFRSSDHGLTCAEGHDDSENDGISLELKCYFVEDILFC